MAISKAKKAEKISLKVLDYAGNTVVAFPDVKAEPGLHRVGWNLARGGGRVAAGTYRVLLLVDGEDQGQPLRVEDDPNVPGPLIAAEEDNEEEEEKEMKREQEARPAKKGDY